MFDLESMQMFSMFTFYSYLGFRKAIRKKQKILIKINIVSIDPLAASYP